MSAQAPKQGDIRLTPPRGIDTPTQPCDDVHLGGVEFFNEGQWGRICSRSLDSWTLDATVICRQLGFPFGGLLDCDDPSQDGIYIDDSELPTWATIVFCTGLEDRLDQCAFPEDFGNAETDFPVGSGLDGPCLDRSVVSVICRRFPMEGADRLAMLCI